MSERRHLHQFNIWAGRVVPLIVLAALGYTLYVITYEIAIQYLLRHNSDNAPYRRSAGIAIIVVQYFIVFFILASWGRFVHTLVVNPGFIPRGERPRLEKIEPSGARRSSSRTRQSRSESPRAKFLERDAVREGLLECPPGLEHFYNKDVFICGMDGVPRFCNVCWNWKPDRTHHSSELNRCVRRYDHYCPWVGGAVSETNNKFFLQFVFYSLLYAIFILIVCVWIILTARADCKKDALCSYTINGHWIGGIVIAVTFGFMAFGIFTRFGWMVLCNTTTIEEVQAYRPRHCLAVRIHESELPRRSQTVGTEELPPLFWVTYPFPNIYGGANGTAQGNRHLYVILMPKQGMNFWNVGYWPNFKSLMGERWWDWFLPIRYSPFVRHEDGFSDFKLGKDFEKLERLYLPHRYGSDGRRRGASRSTLK